MRHALAALLLLVASAAQAADAVPEPAGYRGEPYRAPVPQTLAGATVIDDAEAHRLWSDGAAVFVDVLPRPPKPDLPEGTIWNEPPHPSIPGAIWLPNTGYEGVSPETLAYFLDALRAASGGRTDRPLAFFCRADCWMSWNAAKRALENGFTQVAWYPGGTDTWEAAGHALEPTAPHVTP